MGLATPIDRMDAIGSLEASVYNRVQAVCNFVNAEIARLRHQTIAIGIACIIGAAVLWYVTGSGHVALVVAAGAFALCVVRARAELTSSFSNIAAKRIVNAIAQQLAYRSQSSLSREQFNSLDLFAGKCAKFSSHDEITGRVRGVRYSVHQVQARRGDRSMMFDGAIIRIEYPANFPGHTVVVPDHDGQLLGAMNGGSRRKKDLVMVKNPSFERLFSVYSTDYYEARRLLTPELMKLVIEGKAALGADMRLCFVHRSLFVAVAEPAAPYHATLFAQPLTPPVALGKLVHLIAFAERIAAQQS